MRSKMAIAYVKELPFQDQLAGLKDSDAQKKFWAEQIEDKLVELCTDWEHYSFSIFYNGVTPVLYCNCSPRLGEWLRR